MEVSQKISVGDLQLNMSPSLLKALYEMANFYFKGLKIASVNHHILGKLADRDFLL